MHYSDSIEPAPIFVVGTARSGTTLTANILGRHSRIFMPAETHFFDDIYSRRHSLGNPSKPEALAQIVERLSTLYLRQQEERYHHQHYSLLSNKKKILTSLGVCRDYRDVFSGFMRMQMHANGKSRWGNQVPRDIFNIPEILNFYPNARIIVCVRDVRDFLRSYRDMNKAVPATHAKRLQQIYHPVITALIWRASMRQLASIRKLAPPAHIAIVRYEDLVRQPEITIKKVCKIIGESFEPNMLAVQSHNSSRKLGATNEPGIFASSIGSWHEQLPVEHAYIGQKIAGNELRNLGYQNERLCIDPLRVAMLALSAPFALLRGLRANRNKQAAWFPYLARRVVSLMRSP